MVQWWVFTKIHMPPHKCLPSWLGRQLHACGGGGLVGVGLMVAPRVSSGRAFLGPRQGSCRGACCHPQQGTCRGLVVFLGWDPAKGCRLLSAYLILDVFTKIYMPPRGCLPNPCPLGAVDSRVICSVGAGRVAAARVLPGLLELSPGKDLVGVSASSPLLFMVLALALF